MPRKKLYKRGDQEMTIEITKLGVDPTKRPWIGTCATCKTEFKALKHDLRREVQLAPLDDDEYTCVCLTCSNTVCFQETRELIEPPTDIREIDLYEGNRG